MEDAPIETIPDIPNWSENYAISGYDPESGIHLHFHIGRWRKDLSLWREVLVMSLPDGSAVGHRGIGRALATEVGPGGGHLCVEILEPARRIRYSFLGAASRMPRRQLRDELLRDGPMERVAFDLTFTSDLPVWDMAHVGDATEFHGRFHDEQLGRFEGNIEVGGDVFKLSTMANRDHSRGVRVVDTIRRHTWTQVIFANGVAVLAFQAESAEANAAAFSEACVYADGELYPAKLTLCGQLPLERPYEHLNEPVPFAVDYEKGRLEIVSSKIHDGISTQYTSPWDLYPGRRSEGGVEYQSVAHQPIECILNGSMPGYGHMERTVPGPIYVDQ